MFIYVIIFCMLACLSFVELFCCYPEKYKDLTVKIFSILYIILTTVYAGPIGDYNTYNKYFKNTSISHMYNISLNKFEYLYEVLGVVIRLFTENYVLFRLVLGIIVMILWYNIYEYWENAMFRRYTITILFITWALHFGNIFIIRSTVAVAICIYSIRYIERKDLKKFLILTIVAMGFHMMSIAWIPAYWIYSKVKWKKYYYIVFSISIIISSKLPQIVLKIVSYLGASIYGRVYSYFLQGTKQTYGLIYTNNFTMFKALANIVFLLIVFEYVIYRKKKLRILKDEEHYFNLYLIGIIAYTISFYVSIAIGRAALLYTSVQYFILPQIFDLPEFKKNLFVRYVAYMVMVFYLYLRMYMTIKGSSYVPFNIVF